MKKLLVPLFFALSVLTGCDSRVDRSSASDIDVQTKIDKQWGDAMKKVRPASYAVFPDTDDPKKLTDPTILDAMHGVSPNGSSVMVRADGLVLTNAHVILGTNYCTGNANSQIQSAEDSAREESRDKEATLRSEGKSDTHCLLVTQASTSIFRAKMVKIDKENDVAAFCLQQQSTLPYVQLADTGSFGEGAAIITIGSPFGRMNTLTRGVISNLDHHEQDKETGKKGPRLIQMDAPMLPGNSGGPLVSVASGKLVGLVVAVFGNNIAKTSMSYAIPVEKLKEIVQDIPSCKN